MSKSYGNVKRLMNKHAANRQREAFGGHTPQYGCKADKPARKASKVTLDSSITTLRDGGYAPCDHDHNVATRELQKIYTKYVSVYDKCDVRRKRKSYYRRKATVLISLNESHVGTPRKGSLVLNILRGA